MNCFFPLILYKGMIDIPSFFFSSRIRHTRSLRDWSSDVCSSDLEPPARIYLRFNSKLEKRLSSVRLASADGRPVPLPVVASEGESLDRIVLPLGKLRPGGYVIRYKVLAVDGHITEGALRFSVLEPPVGSPIGPK